MCNYRLVDYSRALRLLCCLVLLLMLMIETVFVSVVVGYHREFVYTADSADADLVDIVCYNVVDIRSAQSNVRMFAL